MTGKIVTGVLELACVRPAESAASGGFPNQIEVSSKVGY